MSESSRDTETTQVSPIRPGNLHSPDAVKEWMRFTGSTERGQQIAAMPLSLIAHFVTLLTEETGPELIGSIDPDAAARLVRWSDPVRCARFMESMRHDDAAEVVRRLDHSEREAVLAQLDTEYAAELNAALRWPLKSTASRMTIDIFTIEAGLTSDQARVALRSQSHDVQGKARTGAQIFVVDPQRRLLGTAGFQDLVLAAPEDEVASFIRETPVLVGPLSNAEDAARLLFDHDLAALPVVDDSHSLLGALTAEEAEDILSEEATRDSEQQGGSTPLDVPYPRASPITLWRKRIVWLLVLFAAEAYTGTVLQAFEDELNAVVALAFFIPLLIGTGGNTGTQITTTFVRALATGQVTKRDLPRVWLKELSAGFLIAFSMAIAGVIRAWTLGVGKEIIMTVSFSLFAIVVWATIAASALPPVLQKLKIDPAVASAPLITTIVDGTGLLIYFLIAHAIIPQLA